MFAKSLLLASVATMCALSMGQLNSMLNASRGETITILVARDNLPPWLQLGQPRQHFESRRVSVDLAPPQAIPLTQLDDVEIRVLHRPMSRGEILTWEHLVDRNRTAVDLHLSPGKRAFAIPLTDAAVAALALPGARIDVLHADASAVRCVAENLPVVAPVQTSNGVALLTVEVTPEQALSLTAALAAGKLSVTLRPFAGQPAAPPARRVTSPPVPVEALLPAARVT